MIVNERPSPTLFKEVDTQILSPSQRPKPLSDVARTTLNELCPGEAGRYLRSSRPEVVAVRLLDYLSSKKGYIKRKGANFRTVAFYMQAMPHFLRAIKAGEPIRMTTLCLCTTLANRRFAGESPYPHMAAYIAFENFQNIAEGARAIYKPGIQFILGYEGNLFRSLYFHNEVVARKAMALFQELNERAFRNQPFPVSTNPISIVDATWMVERTFGSLEAFNKRIEKAKKVIPDEKIADWKEWYRQTVSSQFFLSERDREQFIDDRARWRAAVCSFKLEGGAFGRGFMGFDEDVVRFTVGGRRSSMIALQMVPLSSFLPHQRVMTHDVTLRRWKMVAYEDVAAGAAQYIPRYIEPYSYPFYYEKVTT